jgi:epoxyqueuosine reductase
MPGMRSLADRIHASALAVGFDLAGIAAARPAPDAPRLAAWLARRMHGTMRWMEDPDSSRADPRRWIPWARSLVVVGLAYYTPHDHSTAPGRGVISRYAWGRDYHHEMRTRLATLGDDLARLAPGCRTQAFADTSPVLEKALAEAAGLGWRGKHTNLIRKRFGSWFFLGGLATDLDLDADRSARDHCGRCTLCIEVCPTGAIVAPYVLDARLCIAYLTIENRGPIPRALRPAIGSRIFGCDDCQEVCPWNRFAVRTRVAAFEPLDGVPSPLLPDLFALGSAAWNRRFRKTPVWRAGYRGFLRNVAVALGNWGAPAAAPALVARAGDPSALVRGHVAWALGRIGTDAARSCLEARRAVETDAWVLEEIELALGAAAAI